MFKPSISVVLPVWNGEAFVAEAVRSIIGQTFSNWELIIVDDGSTDSTPEIIRSFGDRRIRIVQMPHAGIVHALNYGMHEANADWIARQDSDDISSPARLAEQWKAVSGKADTVLCHTDIEIIGDCESIGRRPTFPRSTALTVMRFCGECPIVHSTVLFRKAAVQAAGGYRPEDRHAEDFALWGRLFERGRFIGLRRKLLQLRVHKASASKQNIDTQRELTGRIAREHCRRFMKLNDRDSVRTHAVLAVPPAQRPLREWFWFLFRCAPRLRWQSFELYAWLASQTCRALLRRRRKTRVPVADATADG